MALINATPRAVRSAGMNQIHVENIQEYRSNLSGRWVLCWKDNILTRIQNICEPRGPKYLCMECGDVFNTRLSWTTHCKIHLKHFCIVCGKFTETRFEMDVHMLGEHASLVYYKQENSPIKIEPNVHLHINTNQKINSIKVEANNNEQQFPHIKIESDITPEHFSPIKMESEVDQQQFSSIKIESNINQQQFSSIKIEPGINLQSATRQRITPLKIKSAANQRIPPLKIKAVTNYYGIGHINLEGNIKQEQIPPIKLEPQVSQQEMTCGIGLGNNCPDSSNNKNGKQPMKRYRVNNSNRNRNLETVTKMVTSRFGRCITVRMPHNF